MSNYPPGTSAGDPRAPWNAPDTSHEHEFEPVEDEPILEDGAAIFHEQCRHVTPLKTVEGYEGETVIEEGIECEESRFYRFEAAKVRHLPTNLTVAVSPPGHTADISPEAEDAIIEIERAWIEDEAEWVEVDPHPESGRVVAETNDYRVTYEPSGDG